MAMERAVSMYTRCGRDTAELSSPPRPEGITEEGRILEYQGGVALLKKMKKACATSHVHCYCSTLQTPETCAFMTRYESGQDPSKKIHTCSCKYAPALECLRTGIAAVAVAHLEHHRSDRRASCTIEQGKYHSRFAHQLPLRQTCKQK